MVTAEAAQRNSFKKVRPVSFDHNFRHASWEPPGRDGIYTYVMNGPLAGEILRKGDDSTLAGLISDRLKLWRSTPEPGRRRDVDDCSSLLRGHEFADRLAAEKRSSQVCLDHLVPMLEAHLFNRRPPGYARVVYQDIDSPELRDRCINKPLNAQRILHIAAERKSSYPKCLQFLGSLLAALFLAGAKYEIGAHFRKAFRHLSP